VHELERYQEPLAPGTAARRIGRAGIAPVAVAAALQRLADRDLVLVEGAGGLLVHLDTAGGTIVDVAALLQAPVVVVAHARLGTLSAAALACEALRSRGIDCLGVVVGCWPAVPDLAARCNLEDLPTYAGRPLLGWLPEGAARLDPAAFLETVRASLQPQRRV